MTPEQIWYATLSELRFQLTQSSFEVRLANTVVQTYEAQTHTFTVGVPNDNDRDWIQNRLTASIQRILTGISGRPATVAFVVTNESSALDTLPPDETETDPAPDWSHYSVPSVFHKETLETLDWSRAALQKLPLRDYVEHPLEYFEAGIGLTLIGPPGVGKTHLAVGLLKVAALAGWSAHFTGVTSLLDQLRATFGTARDGSLSASERRILNGLANADLLVLDDLRVDGLSVWGRDRVYAVLNPRWEGLKPTIVTTNYQPDELAGALGRERPGLDEGTLSRLLRTALTVELDGTDYRLDRKRHAVSALRARRTVQHLAK